MNLLWLESAIPMNTMTAWVVPEGRKSVQPCYQLTTRTRYSEFVFMPSQNVRQRVGGNGRTACRSKFSSKTRAQLNFQIKLETGHYGRVSRQICTIMSTEDGI